MVSAADGFIVPSLHAPGAAAVEQMKAVRRRQLDRALVFDRQARNTLTAFFSVRSLTLVRGAIVSAPPDQHDHLVERR